MIAAGRWPCGGFRDKLGAPQTDFRLGMEQGKNPLGVRFFYTLEFGVLNSA
jgi:hypothetical protein